MSDDLFLLIAITVTWLVLFLAAFGAMTLVCWVVGVSPDELADWVERR